MYLLASWSHKNLTLGVHIEHNYHHPLNTCNLNMTTSHPSLVLIWPSHHSQPHAILSPTPKSPKIGAHHKLKKSSYQKNHIQEIIILIMKLFYMHIDNTYRSRFK